MTDSTTRRLGGTEWSWAQAVPGGTGITVVAILLSKPPNLPHLQNALHKLQNHHPILRSKLISTPPSYSILPSPFLQIQTVDIPTTSSLLETPQSSDPFPISPVHRLLEHELNINPWAHDINGPIESDLVFATLYALPDSNLVFALRLHTSICDRTTAVALMKELLVLMKEGEGGAEREFEKSGEDDVGLPVEELIPKGKADKPFWTRGLDLVGYSLNSLRLAHLGFEDVGSSRRSEVVRLQMDENETGRLLAAKSDGCFHLLRVHFCSCSIHNQFGDLYGLDIHGSTTIFNLWRTIVRGCASVQLVDWTFHLLGSTTVPLSVGPDDKDHIEC